MRGRMAIGFRIGRRDAPAGCLPGRRYCPAARQVLRNPPQHGPRPPGAQRRGSPSQPGPLGRPNPAAKSLRGLRYVVVERVLGDVGDAVDHHVADLALADEADQSPGRDAQAPGCFGCGEEVSRHRRLRTGQPSRVYG